MCPLLHCQTKHVTVLTVIDLQVILHAEQPQAISVAVCAASRVDQRVRPLILHICAFRVKTFVLKLVQYLALLVE
jgi:hypothetical protein